MPKAPTKPVKSPVAKGSRAVASKAVRSRAVASKAAKRAKASSDDEEQSTGSKPARYFTVVPDSLSRKVKLPSEEGKGGRYSGQPKSAATKAFNRIARMNTTGNKDFKLQFSVMETTRNSNKKLFTYEGVRHYLQEPTMITRGGTEVPIHWQTKLTAVRGEKSAPRPKGSRAAKSSPAPKRGRKAPVEEPEEEVEDAEEDAPAKAPKRGGGGRKAKAPVEEPEEEEEVAEEEEEDAPAKAPAKRGGGGRKAKPVAVEDEEVEEAEEAEEAEEDAEEEAPAPKRRTPPKRK